jgi:hypothetical protein
MNYICTISYVVDQAGIGPRTNPAGLYGADCHYIKYAMDPVGFGPTISRMQTGCSATELQAPTPSLLGQPC